MSLTNSLPLVLTIAEKILTKRVFTLSTSFACTQISRRYTFLRNAILPNSKMKLLKGRKGFTLIELLIVITIIGVLAVALVPRIVGAPSKARDAARKADLQQIATGLELYADTNNGLYQTSDLSGQCIYTSLSANLTDDGALSSVPEDPQNDASDTTSACYSVTTWDTGTNFMIWAEVETPATSDGVYYTEPSQPSTSTYNAADALGDLTACDADNTAHTECYYVIAR
jgi:prepilin-type N-terminal cleavage/methylation domain-containing protein